MAMNFNKETWEEFLDKFSSYEGTVTDYCKENNISKSQFYYYKKKFNKETNSIFRTIEVKPEASQPINTKINSKQNLNNIKIELGRANIYLPSGNLDLLSLVIKQISKLC